MTDTKPRHLYLRAVESFTSILSLDIDL